MVIERAPDSFLTRKPRGKSACRKSWGLLTNSIGRRPEHADKNLGKRFGDEFFRCCPGSAA
ncbi:MAG: hypothetical protein R2867_12415 [Caldilineaceae bacterium]